MPRTVIAEGKTSTEAIEKGLKELKVSKNQVDIKILEEKKKSFFNILDPHIVKVELTVRETATNKENAIARKESKKEASDVEIEKAEDNMSKFLQDFLGKISKDINYKVENEEDVINVVIEGKDSAKLIGYRGEALNAIQTILSTIANKGQEGSIKVILDIGNYKDARKKTLEELAEKIEKTVTKTGKSITLEPMTAYERKIIHTKLQNSKFVKTYSIGEGDRRRIVIAKK